jgi:serine/threonine-protein kinase
VLPTPHSFQPSSLVGTTIDGRYLIVDHLATGGMGAVFRAEHVYMRKQLAVKVLRPELSTLPDIAERFRREAEIAASLDHDHIVRVTDFGRTSDGWLFLVMELLQGVSLYERLTPSVRIDPLETVGILVQICNGLAAAHGRGVVHRDLKPENVFLTAPGGAVKILDFGIAKLGDPTLPAQTQSGIVVGTPEYLSPEQASGGAVDGRADLYAVALMGWRMLAGRHPFAADDPRGLILMQATQPLPSLAAERPDLAEWSALIQVLERAGAKDPDQRPASALELAEALEASIPEGQVAAQRLPTRPLQPLRRRRLRLRVLIPVALLLIAALVGVGVVGSRWAGERPIVRARELLAANQFEAAREVAARALVGRPSEPRLHVLHGRALHHVPGQAQAALRAYAAALDLDPDALDDDALADLQADLKDGALAEQAAQLLARAGEVALPGVITAARAGPGATRLRALDLARQMGGDGHIDAATEYGSLLGDSDCQVRRLAVRRLVELGTPAALEQLDQFSRQTRDVRGLFGFPQKVPVCGATEAAAALRKTGHHAGP